MIVTDHAITIEAAPAAVWPWLVQVGWHRGGWYTAEWVDRLLFPANWPSTDEILPEYQHPSVGDFIPDGPPESKAGFIIEGMERDRHLLLHSRAHLPPRWAARFGAWIDWTWVFVLDGAGAGRTRFHFRTRGRLGPWWVATGYWLAIVPADFVMARQMLRGIKARAEGAEGRPTASASPSGVDLWPSGGVLQSSSPPAAP